MTTPFTVLVMAKAPVPGQVKTRLAQHVGDDAAAELAAAAFLDTLVACNSAGAQGLLCLAGDLAQAVDGAAISRALLGWTVTAQRGDRFAERLVNAHADAGPGLVVQIGMDTPHVTPRQLREAAGALTDHDAVLGPAEDGGWWALARRDPHVARVLADVPMSTPTTYADTRTALLDAGHRVAAVPTLRDVDTIHDARAVADLAPDSRFARAARRLLTSEMTA